MHRLSIFTIKAIVAPTLALSVSVAHGQQGTLTLPSLLASAAANNPAMQAARIEVSAAELETKATERQRWPSLSTSLESKGGAYSQSGGVLRIQQALWDGGRVSAQIDEAKAATETSRAQVQVQKLSVYLSLVDAWRMLLANMGKLEVSDKTIERLTEFQRQIERRVAAGASPAIEVELVKSRLLQTRMERSNAQAGLRMATLRLEQLTGIEDLSRQVAQMPLPTAFEQSELQTQRLMTMNWSQIALSSPSVQKARWEKTQAELRLKTKQAEQWPTVFVRMDQPMGLNASTKLVVGMEYTPGAGFSSAVRAQALEAQTLAMEYAIDSAQRDAVQAAYNDREEMLNSQQQVESNAGTVKGYYALLDSYERQFMGGRKSWQELMNVVRDIAQSEYAIEDSKATLSAAIARLEIRAGLLGQ